MSYNQVIITSNASQGTDVLIDDMGIVIAASGGSETLTDKRSIYDASKSRDLVILCTDDAHGAGSSTLILSNDDITIPQVEVEEYLRKLPISQVWQYQGDPTGFVTHDDSEFSFVSGTRTFTIQPKSPATEYNYFIKGLVFVKSSSNSVILPDVTGLYYIYFDSDVLTASTTRPDDFYKEVAPVCLLYWQSDSGDYIYIGEERHFISMTGDTKTYLHLVERSQKIEGGLEVGDYITDGDGTSDSDAQISVSNGVYVDHDMRENVIDAAVPAADWEQILDPIAKIPVYYKDVDVWKRITATNFPVAYDSPNTCFYNYYNTGTGEWELANLTDGWHFAIYLFATSNREEPVIGILGEKERKTLIQIGAEALVSNLTWLDLPYLEFAFISRLVFQTSTSYTNTPKAALREVTTTPTVNVADRYVFIANYNGNALAGRYLQVFPGVSAEDTGFYIPETSYIRTITLRTQAPNTGALSIFLSTDLVNPIATISLTNENTKVDDFSVLVPSDSELVPQVTSGTMNKPAIAVYMQTLA